MKIYTRTGDAGKTSLLCGKRVSKNDIRLEAYGTVDELVSWIGLIRDQDIEPGISQLLINVQDRLMICASLLACECEECRANLPSMKEEFITEIEQAIDLMEEELKPLDSFILPGGHTLVSWCHIARNVCRRTERNVLGLVPEYYVDELVIRYLNRLSDFLFVLSRKLGKDLNIAEIPWKPGL